MVTQTRAFDHRMRSMVRARRAFAAPKRLRPRRRAARQTNSPPVFRHHPKNACDLRKF